MNVLSLFDGMSCGRIALERAGIEVTNYYASEIDKYAITVSRDNWFDITHIGDVTKVKAADLPQIDLLIGGSPCQGFSFAGEQLNFDDPRSSLFFEYVRLLKECKPKWFFLENVPMKQFCQDVISEHLGVQPIVINSALVSVQNRKRLYWTNIPLLKQPADKGLILSSVIDSSVIDSSVIDSLSEKEMAYMLRSSEKWSSGKMRLDIYNNPLDGKALCLTANMHKGVPYGVIRVGTAEDINGHDYNKRIYSTQGKAPTLAANTGGNLEPKIALNASEYRKLTCKELERCQTVPDNYTSAVSASQRKKMLGNGWTVDVIAHLFKPLKDADIL